MSCESPHPDRPRIIGIDVRVVGQNRRGFEIYIRELVSALARLDSHNRYRLYAPHPIPEFENLAPHVESVLLPSPIHSLDWTNRVLPNQVKKDRVDIIHFPASSIWFRNPSRAVVTVHDLSFFRLRDERLTSPLIDLYHRLQFSWIAKARRVIVVSEKTRSDLIERNPSLADRIRVIPCGLRQGFVAPPTSEISATLQKHEISSPYALFVGGIDRRKNLHTLFKAWRDLDHIPLMIAGPTGSTPGARSQSPEELLKPHPGLSSRVRFLGYVEDQELPALYAGARLFVLPSLYEGFGMPVVESLSCGTAVACSSAGSLPQVAGPGARFFNPLDPSDMARTVDKLWNEPETRRQLVARGQQHIEQFTWSEAARRTLEVYSEIPIEGGIA